MKSLGRLCILAGAIALATPASAQSRDPAAADALFKQGRDAASQGDFATACEKFRESQRLDPALGTLFNIADCEEKLGHVATAWTIFQEVAQRLPGGDDRRPIARQRVAALEKRLPRLGVRLTGDTPPDTTITRGDVSLGPASLDTPLPVDPGTHRIVVSASGHADQVFTITLAEGKTETVDVHVGPPVGVATPGSEEADSAPHGTSKSPTLGYVVGGVGVAGLVVGSVTGIMVLGKKSTVDDNCDADKLCNREGAAAADSGRVLGTVSTVGFVVGAVGIGLGAYFILSSDEEGRPQTAVAPSVGPTTAQVVLGRSF